MPKGNKNLMSGVAHYLKESGVESSAQYHFFTFLPESDDEYRELLHKCRLVRESRRYRVDDRYWDEGKVCVGVHHETREEAETELLEWLEKRGFNLTEEIV